MKSTVDIQVLESLPALRKWREDLETSRRAGDVFGFVPTMGALHDGHLSLIRTAIKECDRVLVSVFVNPLQFGQGEDFDKYPRPFEKDLEFCRQAGVDAVFHPTPEQMYPGGQEAMTAVVPHKSLIDHLCGRFRPGHFEGVATVVTRLFGLVRPDIAFFGEKDFQQLAVIRRVVEDLAIPVQITGCPTLRESDGLAMSSRNVYLSEEERKLAPVLNETLRFVAESVVSGESSVPEALEKGRKKLASVPGLTVQYLEICDADTLEFVDKPPVSWVVLVGAKLGSVRLIDNVIVRPGG